MLFFSPGERLLPALRHGIEQLVGGSTLTEVAMIADRKRAHAEGSGITRERAHAEGSGVTWIEPERAGTDHPFLLYYGEGTAYVLVTSCKPKDGGLPLFHSSDRALVEHLVFQLRKDLGMQQSLEAET